MTIDSQVTDRLKFAVEIAHAAGDLTLKYFRRHDLQVERKADTSPVTIADRSAEELLRERISKRFPNDAILGEELGTSDGTSGYQWVLDPIDGTKSFIHGVPLYTTLVAVLHDDQPRIGVIGFPQIGARQRCRRSGVTVHDGSQLPASRPHLPHGVDDRAGVPLPFL